MTSVELDQHERTALDHFLRYLGEGRFGSNPKVDRAHLARGMEGQIIVPVTISGSEPDVHLAMLMGHKADQLYKQTTCRFVVAQRPEKDPNHAAYVWADGVWQSLP